MKKRLMYGFAVLLLVASVSLVVWQMSFNFRSFGRPNANQTVILWAVSSLIFVLMVTLGFMLTKIALKLYVERQSNREGSRIKTKLVLGALALSIVPALFLVLFSYDVLNRNLLEWFSQPAREQVNILGDAAKMLHKEMADETRAQAALLAAQPETLQTLLNHKPAPGFLERFCKQWELDSAAVFPPAFGLPLDSWGAYTVRDKAHSVEEVPVSDGDKPVGSVLVTARIPLDVAKSTADIEQQITYQQELHDHRKAVRTNYILLMALITLFVLFLATWIAQFMAKQISVPIAALLEAASEVRKGNLRHRVKVPATDELASLVRGFNQMTEALETGGEELDRRRRFTEAILESIPTGVISISADGSIQRVNQALSKIFPAGQAAKATRLEDLFSREDTAEIKYLMKRARRTGAASQQIELRTENRKLQLAVTVAALESKLTSGFVVVLEDTSELLRAQKSAAWHEVARRVAHEIKNPLTPIALSAERIARQIDRLDIPAANARILKECAAAISISVDSVKTLVDEFSQFARFPSAQPVRCELNDVVNEALGVFKGRLEGITIQSSFAPLLPPVNLDREQFQRVVVNLVDNAAEAMQESLVKKLYIATRIGAAETVELIVADSGPGVSPDDKEKLFLPYFSTKNRGTGLGLAIVSHIVIEHGASIRVEDNQPSGARFTVEIPVLVELDSTEPARPASVKV